MKHRFNLAWLLPLLIGAAAWYSPWAAWSALLVFQLTLVGLERLPALGSSPAKGAALGIITLSPRPLSCLISSASSWVRA